VCATVTRPSEPSTVRTVAPIDYIFGGILIELFAYELS